MSIEISPVLEKNEQAIVEDVVKGLSSSPKFLPSKYFYNEAGDRIFQKIIALEEYYLTRAEFEILDSYKSEICREFASGEEGIDIIELGAGDGVKTRLLLEELVKQCVDFSYYPVDISANALEVVSANLKLFLPSVSVIPVQDEYFSALEFIGRINSRKKIILFLGANIGNLNEKEVTAFLQNLHQNLQKEDLLFIGIDLKKNPKTILSAYNDKSGVTAAFNFNLLKRINKELQANFNLKAFTHYPTYDPISGEAKSFLISRERQTIYIRAADFTFNLEPWEPIQTELSKRYAPEEIVQLSLNNHFQVVESFYDRNRYFLNTIWKKE